MRNALIGLIAAFCALPLYAQQTISPTTIRLGNNHVILGASNARGSDVQLSIATPLPFADGSGLSSAYGTGNYAFAGVSSFGDSITVGNGSSPTSPTYPPANLGTPNAYTNSYFASMAPSFGGIPTDFALAGDRSTDESFVALSSANPNYYANVAYTSLIGTNDAQSCGNNAPCLANFAKATTAAYSWLATANQDKIIFGTNTTASVATTGTWTTASNFQANYELSTVTNGSSVTWTTVVPSTTMVLGWSVFVAADTATAALSCDSGAVTDTLTANAASLNVNRVTVAAFANVYTFSAATTHTCTLTASASTGNPFNVIFAGTPPTANTVGSQYGSPTASAPRVFAGGVIRQNADAAAAATLAFDNQTQAVVSALNTAGWNNVVFVPVRNYVNATTDMSGTTATLLNGVTCIGSTQVGLHPNNCGHQHLSDAFLAYAQPVGAAGANVVPFFTKPLYVNTPAIMSSDAGLNNFNPSNTLATSSTLGPGLLLLHASGSDIGFNLGTENSGQNFQVFVSSSFNQGFAVVTHPNGTFPTSNGSFNTVVFGVNGTNGKMVAGPVTAPTNTSGYFNFNSPSTLVSTTNLNAGINLVATGTIDIGWDLGVISGSLVNRMYSPAGHGFAVAHYSGALPTAQAGFTNDFTVTDTGINLAQPISFSGALLASTTAPTIASGFGTSPSVVANNGTAAFTINVGTGGVATTGVITMPTAAHGWACSVRDLTTNASFVTDEVATTTTTISVANYGRTTGVATAWTASDILQFSCSGY